MRAEVPVTFTGVGGQRLEGMLAMPPTASRAVVVCHPHPQYGGDMDNNVVLGVVDRLQHADIATLRFNFRGVGASDGDYSGGTGEGMDAIAAVDFLRQQSRLGSVALSGYSFGAVVALRAGHDHPAVDRLIAIAPPLAMVDTSFLGTSDKPKLFVVGDRDQFCPSAAADRAFTAVPGHNVVEHIPGADHFLGGFEHRVGDLVVRFVTTIEER